VLRLVLAVVVGLVIAIGATVMTVNLLSNQANGSPSKSSLYQYGSR
jgi:K+-transporting ATPase c subunit